MKNSVRVNSEQIKNKTGVQYRASGNLFIATTRTKTVPAGFVGVRGDITGFSLGSGIRMRRYLRECRSEYNYMVTLTYPCEYPCDGPTTKEHLRRFLQELQREDKRKILLDTSEPPHSAFWFLEFQNRGAPHYHIFTNRRVDQKWCSRRWYEIVNSEDIRHLHAGTRCEALVKGRAGTISYASKYAAKMEQKVVPPGFEDVGRFWGIYGCRVTMSADTFVSRADMEDPYVKTHQSRLLNCLKRAVAEGKAEVIVSNENASIAVVHDSWVMMTLRRLTSSLNMVTRNHYDMFMDCEKDMGECYGPRV